MIILADTAQRKRSLNYAAALAQTGRTADAIAQFSAAEQLGPLGAEALSTFGAALAQTGRLDEATVRYERALRLNPDRAATPAAEPVPEFWCNTIPAFVTIGVS